MTTNRREPWRKVVDETAEETGSTNGKAKRAEVDPCEVPQGWERHPALGTKPRRGLDAVDQPPLEMGHDGDDDGQRLKIKFRVDGNGDTERMLALLAPRDMMQSSHGFSIDDQRSRPWKTARRTHCAHCAGELPPPDVSAYRCEFDPDAPLVELLLIGSDQPPELEDLLWPHRPRVDAVAGCQCSGCKLRWLVLNGHERNKGQPKKYCGAECRRLADNLRNTWKRAVARAETRGETPPPEPEDKGLKFVQRRGLASAVEGNGHRYVAATGPATIGRRA